MTKNPWMKFYPSDWRSDPALRMCSLAARGLWVELLAIAHESEPYGHVLIGGVIPSHRQLAILCGCTERETTTLLSELTSAGVCSLSVNGAVISRRMVRDSERVKRDKANGKLGGNPGLKGKDKGGVNPHDNRPVEERENRTHGGGGALASGLSRDELSVREEGGGRKLGNTPNGCIPGEEYDPPFDAVTGEVL